LALFGLAGSTPGTIILSAIEHPSVARPAEALARRGWLVKRIGASAAGVVSVAQFAAALSETTLPGAASRVASVMLANNETGVLQPVAELAAWPRLPECRCTPTPPKRSEKCRSIFAGLEWRR